MGEGSENLVEVDRREQNGEGRDWGDRKKDRKTKRKTSWEHKGIEWKRGWGSTWSFHMPPRAPPTPGD